MTVAQSPRMSGPYTATAGQTVFDYDFPITDASEIVALRLRGTTEIPLELDVDYGVTGVGAPSGTIILTANALEGDVFTLYGRLPIERVTNFSGFRSIPNNTINTELDRMTMSLQEMRRDVDAAIHTAQAGAAYDVQGRRIISVANGIDDDDAATVGQLKPFADAAQAAQASAEDARDAAAASNSAASDSRDAAVYAAAGAIAAKEAAEAAVAGANVPPVSANCMLVDNADGTLRETKTFPQVRALLGIAPLAANSMLVDNADGSLRETKTFQQVRALLGIPSIIPVTPFDFGAIGNGVADDTTALQAWINSGKTSLWMPGNFTYRITSTLQLWKRDAVHIFGDGGGPNGIGSSKVYWGGAAGGTLLQMHSCRHCIVDNIGFQGILGGSPSNPGIGVLVDALNADGSSHFNKVRNCTISSIGGSPGYGILVGSATNDDIAHNIFENNRIVGGAVSIFQYGSQTVHNIYRDNQCLDYSSKGMYFLAGDVRVENPGMFGASTATYDFEIGTACLWASIRGAYHEILSNRPSGACGYFFDSGARAWPTELDACRVLWNRASGNPMSYTQQGPLTIHDCTFDTGGGGGVLLIAPGAGSPQFTRFGNVLKSGITWSVTGTTNFGS